MIRLGRGSRAWRAYRWSRYPLRETSRIAQAQARRRLIARGAGKADRGEGGRSKRPLRRRDRELPSFELGIVRRTDCRLVTSIRPAVAAALPERVQSLLASRVDQLAPADRNAASGCGGGAQAVSTPIWSLWLAAQAGTLPKRPSTMPNWRHSYPSFVASRARATMSLSMRWSGTRFTTAS